MAVGCRSFILPSFADSSYDEGFDVVTSNLCDHIVPEVVVCVHRESERGFIGGSLNLDLGTLDGCRNVAVVREGGLVEEVGNLGRLNRGQAPWWQTRQHQRVVRVLPAKRRCLRRQHVYVEALGRE
jgi:hypothetical protein